MTILLSAGSGVSQLISAKTHHLHVSCEFKQIAARDLNLDKATAMLQNVRILLVVNYSRAVLNIRLAGYSAPNLQLFCYPALSGWPNTLLNIRPDIKIFKILQLSQISKIEVLLELQNLKKRKLCLLYAYSTTNLSDFIFINVTLLIFEPF